jgi:tripartite-type tricarboxylate transporter receptor subunit TctC
MEANMVHTLRASITAITLLTLGITTGPASAEAPFPSRPIKIVLPIPPGSALDVVTRVIGDQLGQRFGQQVVVEPRPGAGGLLAAQAVASAPADGYTLLGGAASIFTILPGQKENLPIDVARDFAQIGMIVGRGVMFVAAPPRLGIKSFPEFAARARSKPGEMIIGTNGAGTLPYYAGLLLQKKGGLPVTIVPYNQGGTSAAIADIMGDRVHATIDGLSGLQGQLQSGVLQLIGAMSPERDPEFPDVPAVAETLPGLTAIGFMSLAAPAKTPEAIVRRLNESLNQTLDTPTVKQRFSELGVPISIVSPAQATAFVDQQRMIWVPLVRELDGR